ncbi:Pentatricopeptide repeat-containing protein [Cardamine amara subsp. amara]|uniref:Pentatricopeptide repeat-containing protein n=1 Tax=Cardamine amara subsp. amara TaxID=228776 RepID=A0ABD0ZBS1_CARAN
MKIVFFPFYRRRKVFYLLDRSLIRRRFSAESDSSTVIKSECEESVAGEFLKHLREIPQYDWASSDILDLLLVSSSSSSFSPRFFSQITRRLNSYSSALSFFEYLNEKSQSLKNLDESLSVAFQSVIEFACKEPESRDKLLQLYETAKEKKVPLTFNAAKFFIRWFGRLGMVNHSVLVYEELDPNVKNTHVRNVFIDVLLKGGLVGDALKVLDEMLEKESIFPPNESTVDIFFHGWVSMGGSERRLVTDEEMIQLVLKFGDHGLSPNSIWLTRFITSLCKNGQINVAWETLSKLMKNKASLEAPPFNAVLTSLGRNMDIGGMNAVVAEMDEMGNSS